MRLAAIICLAVLTATVVGQQQVGPFLVSNPKLTDFLVQKVYPVVCDDAKNTTAYRDILAREGGVWTARVNRVAADFASNHTEDRFILNAIKEAVKQKDAVQNMTLGDAEWNDYAKVKYVIESVYAISDGTSVDYYHFEFHLNLQGRIPQTKDEYIKAIGSFACFTQKEWIGKYLVATPKAAGK